MNDAILCPLQMTFVPIHEFYLLYKGCVRGLFLAIYLNSKWQVQLPLTKFIYYLVGSTYLFILPVHDSDQFFPSGVYYLLKGGRWLRSPLQNRKKTSICNHSDICTFKHYICIYSGTNQVHFPSSSTFKKQEDVIYLWQKPL